MGPHLVRATRHRLPVPGEAVTAAIVLGVTAYLLVGVFAFRESAGRTNQRQRLPLWKRIGWLFAWPVGMVVRAWRAP